MTDLLNKLWRWLMPFQVILIVGTLSFLVGVSGTLILLLMRGTSVGYHAPPAPGAPPQRITQPLSERISPLFTPEVRYWEPQIIQWAKTYQIDPNMLATVMQIESCGDWQAGSVAGAQGLFQVMPFHFSPGADPQDPETNAQAGIAYLKQSLQIANGHFGLALAGYNGGHGVIRWGWARWASETRRYYLWGSGIYLDAVNGKNSSETLQDWLNAGGGVLCQQAAARQALQRFPTPQG
jgi:hypothetical protein